MTAAPARAAAAADGPGLPAIDGLDLAEARARLGDDPAALLAVLAQLAPELAAAEAALASAADPAAQPRAAERLHQVRGAAGHVGARALCAAAGAAERALRGGDPAAIAAAVPAAAAELARLRGAIAAAAHAHGAPVPSPQPPRSWRATAGIAPALSLLVAALTEQHIDAAAHLPALSGLLDTLLGPATTRELAALLDRLDYAAARALLERAAPR